MSMTPYKLLVDGNLKDSDQPVIQADSRGLMYGDGCFETFCTYQGRAFMPGAHLKRLKQGLAYLNIDLPVDLKASHIGTKIDDLLQANKLKEKEALIRIQVWRAGGRGYKTHANGSAHYVISAIPKPVAKKHYRLATVSTRRIPSAALASQYKLSNGINYIKAATEARQNGADDALMQTIEGWVAETTIANIFWMKENTVFTPAVSCDILPGISRKIILQLLNGHCKDVTVNEGQFYLDELQEASAVWICNSVKGVAPVSAINEQCYRDDHPFVSHLLKLYQLYKRQELKKVI